MEIGFKAFILFTLLVSGFAWPRYGRPHPLYNGRIQTNENLFANAVLLGLDFNDLQTLQAASGNTFGLGNIGLPNMGFPMNVYERKRARQDVNTLTALGVIDGPEEAGPYGSLMKSNKPDPPDNPGGKDGVGKGKNKKGKKIKIKKKKGNGKVANKRKQVVVKEKHVQTISDTNVIHQEQNTQAMIQDTNSKTIPEQQGFVPKGKINKVKSVDTAGNLDNTVKTMVPKQKLATDLATVMQQTQKNAGNKRNNRKVVKAAVKKPKKRKNKRKRGNSGEGGDPGEGRRAERGDLPFRSRGKRVLWRSSGGEDAQIGRSEVLDRRFIGRF